jgi:hypothetical protein
MGFSPESYTFMTMGRLQSGQKTRDLKSKMKDETVFGLNLLLLSKVLENPLGCYNAAVPL